jgi:CDP-6-deoxy-D-xylo-4-hexulose-3-dehydrase
MAFKVGHAVVSVISNELLTLLTFYGFSQGVKNMKYPLMKNNISREDLDLVIDHLKTNDPILTNGPHVLQFEKKWSDWLGVKYSVFVNSGASANLISMAILKIKYPLGGEVIVPPLTWVSDISTVLQNGFTPIFVDINPSTLSMNTEEILKKITSKTRAVFITHAQGFNGLTDKLILELNKRNIPLIEDVCESHGAVHNDKKLGSIGWISNFSYYYAHHMSTIEGGMVCTNDEAVYQQARMLRSHGMVREISNETLKNSHISNNPELNKDFIFAHAGFNVRNTEIGGILGLSQLKRLDVVINKRSENFKLFLESIDKSKFRTDFKLEGSSNYAFNLVLKEPNHRLATNLMTAMNCAGIEFRRGSAGGGNQLRQPYLRGIVPEKHYLNFPETEHVHFFGFYMGNYPDLTRSQISEICTILNQAQG